MAQLLISPEEGSRVPHPFEKLAQTLLKAGYTAEKVVDKFGRETINYVKEIEIKP